MRRVALVVVLILAGGLWPAVQPPAAGATAAPATAAGSLQADFNNDGFADLAVGVPDEALGDTHGAGAVTVLYGSPTGLSGIGSQLFTQDTPGVPDSAEEGDKFGSVLATGDFNGDTFADLAVGVPSEGVGGAGGAGAVSVLYGSATGLSGIGSQYFTQVAGIVEQDDQFGWALAVGDFNHDSFADLAAGAPGEDLGSAVDAGVVSVLPGSVGGLTAVGGQLFRQVAGDVEAGDRFGEALAAGDFNHDSFADLAAGAPFEDIGGAPDAGAVSVAPGSAGGLTAVGGRLFTQVAGAVEAGDRFGWALAAGDFNHDSFADLAADALLEDVGSISAAGAVSVLYGSVGGLTAVGGQLLRQIDAEVDDLFGWALAVGDFNHDSFADLAAGARDEDVGSAVDAGVVSVLYGSATGLSGIGSQYFTQVAGTMEAGDLFGHALAVGDFNHDSFADLAAGAPSEEDLVWAVNAGAVSVAPGSAGGLTAVGGQLFTQDTPGVPDSAEAGDHFGITLAAGDPGPSAASASP